MAQRCATNTKSGSKTLREQKHKTSLLTLTTEISDGEK